MIITKQIMLPMVFAHGQCELCATLLTEVAVSPRSLAWQSIQQTVQQLFCCHLHSYIQSIKIDYKMYVFVLTL